MANKKAIGAGMLAAAATAAGAAAGYYFYASKNAKKNRKVAAKWASDLQKDVIKRAGALQRIDRAAVAKIVEQSARAYQGLRDLDRGEVERAAKELKSNWKKIAGELTKAKTSTKGAARRIAKRGKGALKQAAGAVQKTKKLARKMASPGRV